MTNSAPKHLLNAIVNCELSFVLDSPKQPFGRYSFWKGTNNNNVCHTT